VPDMWRAAVVDGDEEDDPASVEGSVIVEVDGAAAAENSTRLTWSVRFRRTR